MKYDSDGELKDVIATSPTLKEVRDHTENRTGVYDCEVCEEAYDIVCNEGVASVCKLDDYGSPIRGVPSTSIEIMCATFGQACSNTFSARKACKGQCKETEGEGLARLVPTQFLPIAHLYFIPLLKALRNTPRRVRFLLL